MRIQVSSRHIAIPIVAACAAVLVAVRARPQEKPMNVDWPSYNADTAGSRYLPLDQINASNFNELEVAWRFKTDNIGNRPEYKLEGTPLEVNGVVYATAGSRRAAIALDAVTGELLWVHGEHEGERAAAAPRQLSGRGLAYWSDGKEARILYVTQGYRLVCLDAKTGTLIPSFGQNGVVDLKLEADQTIMPDLTTGEIGLHSTPVVGGNTVIVGSSFAEGTTPKSFRNNKGIVRGYDVRTGKRLWAFHNIPKKGENGYDTWLNGSAEYTGNTGTWAQVSIDEKLGLAYLPVEDPTGDYYGGHRPGNNLYGDSLVCVDLKTGERKWFFQMVHHPLWDLDMSSAPLLMDIVVDGKPIKAVAQPTKQSFLYVFDRVTGKPVWPIEERPVEKGSVPGEWYPATQPFPTKPPAYAVQGFSADNLIDFTPDLHRKALEVIKKYHYGPLYTPPVVSKLEGPLGTLMLSGPSGGTNWPGGSFNPETHTAFIYACDGCLGSIGLVVPPKDFSDMNYVGGTAGRPLRMILAIGTGGSADSPMPGQTTSSNAVVAGGGGGGGEGGGLTVDGLPLVKPPYGSITAINVDKGEISWKVAHGETPDYIRNSPALKGVTVPRTGAATYNIGTLVTKHLVIAGEGILTTTPDHPRGAMLRAYDQANGKEVGAVFMPAPQSGNPMTYMVNGKQYIIVAVSGGNYSGEYIAYTLPSH
jgi:quinoprotein glucose dehydrogenase